MKNVNLNRKDKMSLKFLNEHDEIDYNLYQGGIPTNLDKFQYVINLVGTQRYHVPIGRTVIIYPFNDAPIIPNEEKLFELSELAVKYSNRGPTLIHCAMGVNRSGLVMALTLMNRNGLSAKEAIELIRGKRSEECLSNKTFEEWLLNLKI